MSEPHPGFIDPHEDAGALARAFSGLGRITPERLSETASWTTAQSDTILGRDQILDLVTNLTPPQRQDVTQIVSEGKAVTVSGRMLRDTETPVLFCHVLRFTTSARDQIAQVVSFEHPERPLDI